MHDEQNQHLLHEMAMMLLPRHLARHIGPLRTSSTSLNAAWSAASLIRPITAPTSALTAQAAAAARRFSSTSAPPSTWTRSKLGASATALLAAALVAIGLQSGDKEGKKAVTKELLLLILKDMRSGLSFLNRLIAPLISSYGNHDCTPCCHSLNQHVHPSRFQPPAEYARALQSEPALQLDSALTADERIDLFIGLVNRIDAQVASKHGASMVASVMRTCVSIVFCSDHDK